MKSGARLLKVLVTEKNARTTNTCMCLTYIITAGKATHPHKLFVHINQITLLFAYKIVPMSISFHVQKRIHNKSKWNYIFFTNAFIFSTFYTTITAVKDCSWNFVGKQNKCVATASDESVSALKNCNKCNKFPWTRRFSKRNTNYAVTKTYSQKFQCSKKMGQSCWGSIVA